MSVEIKRPSLDTAYYLNGFPKSGLHLLAAMVLPVAKPLIDEDGPFDKPWAGSFLDNSWTTRWSRLEPLLYKTGRLRAGTFLKAHTGHNDAIEQFLYYLGCAHVFIYRDPRDVAVSQAYHVVDEDDVRFAHPDKELYRALGSFDDVLAAVIEGIEGYPGVMERWALYAPWLEVDWTLKVRFEDAVRDTAGTAERVLTYGLERVARVFGSKPVINREAFDLLIARMVEAVQARTYSSTFRQGTAGSWREHFAEQHKWLFKESDADGWLTRLGYAEGGW